jgi:hypothetical protein
VERLELESYRKRKAVTITAVALIVMFTVIYFAIKVYADDTPSDGEIGFAELASWTANPIIGLLKGGMVRGICDRYFDPSIKSMVLDFDIWNPIITFFKSIGLLVCFFNMMIKIIKTCERGEMTAEQFIGVFLALAIPAMLIFEYDKVVDAVSKVADYIYTEIVSTWSKKTESSLDYQVAKLVNDNSVTLEFSVAGIGRWVGGTLAGIITWLSLLIINFIMGIQIVSSIISLYMQITVRYIFMPVAIANVAEDGPRSSGMKYILKYIAAHVHVASIVIIVQILFNTYIRLISAMTAEGMNPKLWELIFIWLCLPAALKAGISMSGEIIKDAFGVGM